MFRRRWFQFSLRGFLIAVAVLSMWLGWKVDRARRQREGIRGIAESGGHTYYSWQLDPIYAEPLKKVPECPASEWLRRMVGDDFLFSVARVDFGRELIRNGEHSYYRDDPELLSKFDANRIVALWTPSPTTSSTLAALPAMPNLTNLNLGISQIADDGLLYLAKFPKLTYLTACFVTDTGLLNLARTNKNLKSIIINWPEATEEGIAEFKALVPGCKVGTSSNRRGPGRRIYPTKNSLDRYG